MIRKSDWDDRIPDDFRQVWVNHFQMMTEISTVKFRRAVIPQDAVKLDVQILCFGDASNDLVCVAIYVRFRKKYGSYSCQLTFGR